MSKVSESTLLEKIEKVINDWHNLTIKKSEAEKLIAQITKDYHKQLELF